LKQASEDDGMTDFTSLVDTSDEARIKAVTILNDLFFRTKAKTVPIPRPALQVLPSIPPPSGILYSQNQVDGRALPLDFHASTGNQATFNDTRKESEAGMTSKCPSQPPPSSQTTERSETSPGSPKPMFSRMFSRKPTAAVGETCEGKPQYRKGSPDSSMSSHNSASYSKRFSAMTISSQGQLDEDNPWASELSRSPNDAYKTHLLGRRDSQMKSPDTFRRQSTNESKPPFDDLYGGFCKGAYKLQVGLKDGLKLRNQSGSFQGEGYYWACGSSKCAFEGLACKEGKEWTFDDSIHRSCGVRYRWAFLAKSHIAMSKAKNGIYDYRCVFCVFQGQESPVFRKTKVLIEHVSSHRGQSLDDGILRRTNCIDLRQAADEEEFDINLTPADSEVAPGEAVEMVPGNDLTIWSKSEDAMSDTNHWRDST